MRDCSTRQTCISRAARHLIKYEALAPKLVHITIRAKESLLLTPDWVEMRTSARAARAQNYDLAPAMNWDHAVSWGKGSELAIALGSGWLTGIETHTKGQNHTYTKGQNHTYTKGQNHTYTKGQQKPHPRNS